MAILSIKKIDNIANEQRGAAVKWELDLWNEIWDRAGSQGLDTWYPIGGRVEREREPNPARGPNADGTGGAPPVDPGGNHE
jgi:hypothetical protein